MALVNCIFIDDDFFSQKYPLPIKVERKNMLSAIEMAQATKLRSFLGSCLYEDLETKFIAQTLSADEETLMGYLQYLLVFYTAIEMADFILIDNSLSESQDRDAVMQSNSEKADAIEIIARRFIIATDAIYAIGTATDCDDKFEIHDTNSESGIHYPYSPASNDNCGLGFWKWYPTPD